MHPILESAHIPWSAVNTIILTPSIQWLPVLFRTMALVVAAPLIFLYSLDVAAYLIARTLGAPHHHRHIHKTIPIPTSSPSSSSEQQPTIVVSPPCVEPCSLSSALSSLANPRLPKASHQLHPNQLPTPPSDDSFSGIPHTHFASASDGNFALSGEGVFSPPESRSNSPPLNRKAYRTRKRTTSIGVESTSEEDAETESTSSSLGGPDAASSSPPTPAASLRKRKPGLQFTPMKA